MNSVPVKTVRLGSENDELLRQSLNDVVLRLGAKQVTHECTMGPQAYERVEAEVRSKRLVIDAKTNAGISIFGPTDLVDEIHGMVQHRLSKVTPQA
jgi:hypothetical protein